MKNIVLYCDQGMHELALDTIASFNRVADDFVFHYFTIDFKPTVDQANCVVYPIEYILAPHPQFIKPYIFLEALKHINEFIYVDCDLIASKSFDYSDYVKDIQGGYPYCPRLHETAWQRPNYFWSHNNKRFSVNEDPMMEYLNVRHRTQPWVTTLMVGVNSECTEFIQEWSDVMLTEKLWTAPAEFNTIPHGFKYYFCMPDESVLNVLFWKSRITDYYRTGAVLEPKKLESFVELESNRVINKRIEAENELTDCLDSSKVYVYHQLKDLEFRNKIMETFLKLNI